MKEVSVCLRNNDSKRCLNILSKASLFDECTQREYIKRKILPKDSGHRDNDKMSRLFVAFSNDYRESGERITVNNASRIAEMVIELRGNLDRLTLFLETINVSKKEAMNLCIIKHDAEMMFDDQRNVEKELYLRGSCVGVSLV